MAVAKAQRNEKDKEARGLKRKQQQKKVAKQRDCELARRGEKVRRNV